MIPLRLLFALAVLGLASWKIPQVVGAESGGELITTFGEHEVGNVVVEAKREDRKIKVTFHEVKQGPGVKRTSSTGSSPDWGLEDGWFAFVEATPDKNLKRVWIYSGGDDLNLVKWSRSPPETGVMVFSIHNRGGGKLPERIPAEVMEKLKEPLKGILSGRE